MTFYEFVKFQSPEKPYFLQLSSTVKKGTTFVVATHGIVLYLQIIFFL